MKLTDQEQVILKAIGHVGRGGLALISEVVRAVGYPKVTTKKVLVALAEKGIVSLHRHDWPQSLMSADRKLMVRLKGRYYSAVSVMKRNPKGKHLAGATAKQQRQYEAILKSIKKSGRYKGREKEVAARTVRARAKNKSGKGKQALKTTGRALKKAASSVLGAGSQILGAGSKALNPRRGRNSARLSAAQWANEMARLRDVKPRPLHKLYGRSGGTPEQQAAWKAQMSEWNRQYRHASKMQKIALEEDNAAFRVRQAQNKAKKKRAKRNASRNLRSAKAPKTRRAGASRSGRKAAKKTSVRSAAKTRKAPAKRASSNPTRKGMRKLYREAKRISKITRGRYFSSESGQRKAARHEKRLVRKSKLNPTPTVLALVNRTSPKARQNRKEFAGEYRQDAPLYYPEGTPAGLSKLGKLLKIKTDRATIMPTNNQTWLVRDLKGKLHIGTTSKDGVIWSGPAEDFGRVRRIEYEDVKKHLGYDRPQGFYHFMGEENGKRPTLHADGKGGLKFRGGDYKITPEGIVN